MKLDDSRKLQMLTAGAAITLAAATRWSLRKSWSLSTGEDPPDNPAAPGVSWRGALAWGALSGVTAGVARVVARRWASEARRG